MIPLQTIALRYGHGSLEFPVPATAELLDICEPQMSVSLENFRQGLAEILPTCIPAGPVAIVVADKTRLCAYPLALPWLLTALEERGATPDRIVFYIAYGNHAPQTEAESQAAYGPTFSQYPFVQHCSSDADLFVELGTTRSGTPVRVRRELLEAGLILTVGAISHHYFAGFGGGRKLMFPGLGEQQAIYANHRLFLDTQRRTLAAGCRPGQMAGNPLAEDLEEIHRLLPPYLSIHGLPNSSGQIAAFRFGRTYEEFLGICREHDHHFQADIDRQFDLVLASAGGYPKDINLIQAHKAIDNGAAFVRDGGTLLLLAECQDGIGSDTFLPYFAMGGWESAFDQLDRHYSGNGGTALAMMAKTGRITIALITALDLDFCTRIGVTRLDAKKAAHLLTKEKGCVAVIRNSSMLIR